MNNPYLKIRIKEETLNVTDSVISPTESFVKKLDIQDESNVSKDCNLSCGLSLSSCNGSCVNITLASKSSGIVKLKYIY